MYSFLRWLYKSSVRKTKHAASKKGYIHNWNPSKGQRKDIINNKGPLGVIK